jgi:DNA-binding MarR family transcriptional regulator
VRKKLQERNMTKQDLRKVQRFLTNVRRAEGDMSVQRLQVLIQGYLGEELDQTSLVKGADLSPSATSKHIASWTKLTAAKKPGPGYLESRPDPMNLKTRIISLTPRGREAVESILEHS